MKIITNNVPRDMIEAHELTEQERAKFDYLNWPAINRGKDSATFVRYHGVLYCLGDFLRTDQFDGWHGTYPLGFHGSIMVRLLNEDQVVLGYATG